MIKGKNGQVMLNEVDFSEATFVRKEGAIPKVKNVSLLGEVSKNGYKYSRSAMRNAIGMYEGVQAFINHPSQEEMKLGRRDVRNLAGKFQNIKFDESAAKIRGDFVGLPNDNGKLFIDIAEHMPLIAGTSQNAAGKFDGSGKVVESITKVFSVDLVANPATNKGVFESFQDKEQEMEWNDITLDELTIRRKDLAEAIHGQGAKSRDDEFKALKEEKDTAVQEADTLKVEKAMAGKTALVDKLLDESKLPKEAKTKVFREQVLNLEPKEEGETIEDQAKLLIQDRFEAVSGKKVVKNMGSGKELTEDHKTGDGNVWGS